MKIEADELAQQPMQILKVIAKGEQAIKEGKVMTHEEVKKSFSRWLDIGIAKETHRNN